jgi:molybdopterin converting factor small subunit
MPHVTMELPSLLRGVLGGTDTIPVEGETLRDALEDAYRKVPALRVHLCEESGALRPHVLCFVNEVNSRWLDERDPRLREGDLITILQAVSGG